MAPFGPSPRVSELSSCTISFPHFGQCLNRETFQFEIRSSKDSDIASFYRLVPTTIPRPPSLALRPPIPPPPPPHAPQTRATSQPKPPFFPTTLAPFCKTTSLPNPFST